MSTISEKIRKFEKNCIDMSDIETNELEQKIDKEINERIFEEIREYKNEAERNLKRKITKIEKEYNSEIFKINNHARLQVINKKQELNNQLKNEVKTRISNFTDEETYFIFLLKNIEQSISKVEPEENDIIKLGLTEKDINKYKESILNQYKVEIYSIDNNYIGGTICTNLTKNIYADNTLKLLIEEIDFE